MSAILAVRPEHEPVESQREFRFYDPGHARVVVRIGPGEYYLTSENEAIVTILGSCVSVCIRDSERGLGGMNHFMLPGPATFQENAIGAGNRYGVYAMETLLNEYYKCGGSHSRLEIKVTGGGRIGSGSPTVSESNVRFIHRFLETEGLNPLAVDLGGNQPRKVFYDPATGQLKVKKLPAIHGRSLIEQEKSFRAAISAQPVTGTVELF